MENNYKRKLRSSSTSNNNNNNNNNKKLKKKQPNYFELIGHDITKIILQYVTGDLKTVAREWCSIVLVDKKFSSIVRKTEMVNIKNMLKENCGAFDFDNKHRIHMFLERVTTGKKKEVIQFVLDNCVSLPPIGQKPCFSYPGVMRYKAYDAMSKHYRHYRRLNTLLFDLLCSCSKDDIPILNFVLNNENVLKLFILMEHERIYSMLCHLVNQVLIDPGFAKVVEAILKHQNVFISQKTFIDLSNHIRPVCNNGNLELIWINLPYLVKEKRQFFELYRKDE